MTAPGSWRDRLAVHPACKSFREMTSEELADLAEDIVKNKLINPIVFWRAADDQPYQLIDGRSRLDAMAMLPDGEARIAEALRFPIHKGSDTDPWKYAESVNDHRRHLTPEDRRKRLDAAIEANQGKSARQIAKIANVSPTTASAAITRLEQSGTVSRLDTRIGGDGVAQPAHKSALRRQSPAALVHNTTPRPAPASKEQQLRDLREHRALSTPPTGSQGATLADQIEAFRTQLKALRSDIERIDRPTRLRLARGLVVALGIDPAEFGGAP